MPPYILMHMSVHTHMHGNLDKHIPMYYHKNQKTSENLQQNTGPVCGKCHKMSAIYYIINLCPAYLLRCRTLACDNNGTNVNMLRLFWLRALWKQTGKTTSSWLFSIAFYLNNHSTTQTTIINITIIIIENSISKLY